MNYINIHIDDFYDKKEPFFNGASIVNKKIFLFATVGFGGSEEYFATLKERIIGVLPSSNVVIGSFFCQGKMKEQVKARYLQLITENLEDKNLQVSLQNFEQAKTHPDTEDKNISEVIIAKHRAGSTGTVKLLWMGNYTKFDNLARGYDD